jgi:ElaB/YqjD/DUF883 family membrane-anchored ribosome-binding protein
MKMNEIRSEIQDGQQRLTRDVQKMMQDAEALLRTAANGAGDGYAEARSRLEESLKAAKSGFGQFESAARDQARAAAQASDEWVRRHPWETIGVGAALGLLVGVLLSRK